MPQLAPKIKLSNGFEMPVIAMGTYKALEGEVYEAVKAAIDIGYRHFDTAFAYQNEAEIGRAIREKIAEGKVKREDIFVTSKLWTTEFSIEKVVPACKGSLDRLGLDYIDLYLLHWPMAMQHTNKSTTDPLTDLIPDNSFDYIDTWKGMEECVRLEYVRSIGISNFNSKQVQRLLDIAQIKPVNNQVECSVQLNQKKLINFCKKLGIVVSSYCPLARPVPAEKKPKFLFDEHIIELGKKYGKTPAQIAIRYLVDIGTVPLPKSSNVKRLKENFNIFDFKLSEADLKVLDSFNTGERTVLWESMSESKHFPFDEEF